MPQFKTKDLLVSVLPVGSAKENCLFNSHICIQPTYGCERYCSFVTWRTELCCYYYGTRGCGPWGVGVTIQCPPGTYCAYGSVCPGGSGCPGTWDPPYVIQNLEDLAALKADLQATLKSLDVLQKEGLPSSIGSKSEAEALERGLTEALEQVRAAKKKR